MPAPSTARRVWMSLRATPEQEARVRAAAAQHHITLTELVTQAVDEWITSRDPQEGTK